MPEGEKMDNQISQARVKPIFAYIKDAIKFYEIDNPLVAQVVFLLQLAIIFGGYIFARPYTAEFLIYFEQYNTRLMSLLESKSFDVSVLTADLLKMMDPMVIIMLILFVTKSAVFIASLYYGTYYYFSQTQPEMKGAQRTGIFFRKLPKIILFNLLFYSALMLISTLSMALFMIPVLAGLTMVLPIALLIINTLFMFKDLLIIEFDVHIFRNFKKSLDITRGCRKNVIMNGLWPMCLGLLAGLFAIDVQNPMLSLFISSFTESIFILVSQRLTALMFIDAASLERRAIKSANKADK